MTVRQGASALGDDTASHHHVWQHDEEALEEPLQTTLLLELGVHECLGIGVLDQLRHLDDGPEPILVAAALSEPSILSSFIAFEKTGFEMLRPRRPMAEMAPLSVTSPSASRRVSRTVWATWAVGSESDKH